jgi:hypothetical protein
VKRFAYAASREVNLFDRCTRFCAVVDYPLPATPSASTADPAAQREALRASLLRRSASDASSVYSAHIDHSWRPGKRRSSSLGQDNDSGADAAAPKLSDAAERSSKRRRSEQLTAGAGNRSVAKDDSANVANEGLTAKSSTREGRRGHAEPAERSDADTDDSHSGSEDHSHDGDSSWEGDHSTGFDEDAENSAVSRAFVDIPSFSFLRGSYRLYHDAVHTVEEAGAALLEDASAASRKLYHAVKDTIETVVHDIVHPDEGTTVQDGKPKKAPASVERKSAGSESEEVSEGEDAVQPPRTPSRRKASANGANKRRQSASTASKRLQTASKETTEDSAQEETFPSTTVTRSTRSAVKARAEKTPKSSVRSRSRG